MRSARSCGQLHGRFQVQVLEFSVIRGLAIGVALVNVVDSEKSRPAFRVVELCLWAGGSRMACADTILKLATAMQG